jgi:iron complex outermembrane receptor protein
MALPLPIESAPAPEVTAGQTVVVTARKREEDSQTVPIALSVRLGKEFEQRETERLQDIVPWMPNVSADIPHARAASIAIRGLGKNPASDGLESSVAIYVDGVYLGRTGMLITDLVDIERFELLRGPQGTLFGKNSTAGAINVTTRPPGAREERWLEMGAGDFGLWRVRAGISGPLSSSRAAFRLSGFATSRDGLVRNKGTGPDLAEIDRAGARAQLVLFPDSPSRWRLIADYSSQDETGPGYVLVDPVTHRHDGTPRPNNFLERVTRAGYVPEFNPEHRRADINSPQRLPMEQGGISIQVDHDFAQLRFTSLSAWRMWNFRPENDGDGTPLDVQPVLGTKVSDDQFSQELRVATTKGDRWNHLAGAYFFLQELTSINRTEYGADAADFSRPGLPAVVLDGFSITSRANPRTVSRSVFWQTDYRASKTTSITAGMRWTREDRKARIERTSGGGAALAPDDTLGLATRARIGAPALIDVDTDEDFLSAVLSISWQPTPRLFLYSSASRGAKSGGINTTPVPAGLSQKIQPEVATSYELGVKSSWADDKVRLNASVFAVQSEDYQAVGRDQIRGATFLTNAGEVKSHGAESELTYQPFAGLKLAFAAGWHDARYEAFHSAPCPPEIDRPACDFTGTAVVGTPPWTANLQASFSKPTRGGRYEWNTGLDYVRSASYRAEFGASTQMPSYQLVNAFVGLASGSKWSLTTWCHNLLDEDYFTTKLNGGSFGTGLVVGIMSEPRTFGITFRMQN